VPHKLLLVDRHDGGCGVFRVLGGEIPRGASTVGGWVGAGQDLGAVGEVDRKIFPDYVGGNEGKGAGRVVLRTEVAGQCFSLFKPRLEIGSRVMGERVGKGNGHVR
jgi:hypothetical protein